MKKIALFIPLLVLLIGCKKEKIETTASQAPVVSKLEVVMNVEDISADILDYFTVEYIYKDFEGNIVTKAVTKSEKFSFSIDNPTLGEEASTPFTVQLKLTQKGTEAKPSGTYNSTFKWKLDVNAYDKTGGLITDSGTKRSYSRNATYDNDEFAKFLADVTSQAKMAATTYKTFFCNTVSGEWHIGVEVVIDSGVIIITTK